MSKIEELTHQKINNIDVIEIAMAGNKRYILAFNSAMNIKNNQSNTFTSNGSKYQFYGRFKLFEINFLSLL